jgi:hypothetical protein
MKHLAEIVVEIVANMGIFVLTFVLSTGACGAQKKAQCEFEARDQAAEVRAP